MLTSLTPVLFLSFTNTFYKSKTVLKSLLQIVAHFGMEEAKYKNVTYVKLQNFNEEFFRIKGVGILTQTF